MPQLDYRRANGGPSMLVLSRGGHPGIDDALRRMTVDGSLSTASHLNIAADNASPAAWENLAQQVRDQMIEFVVFHHYHSHNLFDPSSFIRSVQAQEHRPVVAFTGGDAFYNGFFRPSHPKVFKSVSAAADLVLNTSMGGTADAIAGYGAKRVALFPNGTCQVQFPKPKQPHRADQSEFDVCFIGSNNRSRNPGRSYFWYGRQRERLVKDLYRKFGDRFAVFGNGWDGLPAARGPVPFHEQIEACRRARVIVGGVPYSPARYYTSNRPFNQIVSGVPFVDVAVDGVNSILRDGEHWHLVESPDRVADRVDDLLARSDAERVEMGDAAASFITKHHTYEQRWRQMVRMLTPLREDLIAGREPRRLELDFLLPESRTPSELALATRGW